MGKACPLPQIPEQTLGFHVQLKCLSNVPQNLSVQGPVGSTWPFPLSRTGLCLVLPLLQNWRFSCDPVTPSGCCHVSAKLHGSYTGWREAHPPLSPSSAQHHWQLAHDTACKSLWEAKRKDSVFAALSSLRKGLCSRHCSPQIISRALHKAQHKSSVAQLPRCLTQHVVGDTIFCLSTGFSHITKCFSTSLLWKAEQQQLWKQQADWGIYVCAKSMQNTQFKLPSDTTARFYPLPLPPQALW